MNDLWTSIPLGTVPQRPRPESPAAPAPAPPAPVRPLAPSARPAPSAPPTLVPAPSPAPSANALDAATTAVEDDPTNRLRSDALATRRALPPPPTWPPGPARPAPSHAPKPTPTLRPTPPPTMRPTPTAWPSPSRPQPTPAVSPRRSSLPAVALAALLGVVAAVLIPWPGTTTPWVASSPLGLALLAGSALVTVPVVIALLSGTVRGTGALVGLPVMIAAAAGTVVVAGGDLPSVLAGQGLDVDTSVAPAVLAAALLACLVVGIAGVVGQGAAPARVGATTWLVGVCAGVSLAALSVVVVVLAAPAPQTAEVVTAAGTTPAAASTPAAGSSACPAEATGTLPEPAVGAPVVAHDSRVHIAICQGASGALYYYGADDRTHLTITLPAYRGEDSWIATNNGVTYFVTADNLMITKPGVTLADEALTSGWTR